MSVAVMHVFAFCVEELDDVENKKSANIMFKTHIKEPSWYFILR